MRCASIATSTRALTGTSGLLYCYHTPKLVTISQMAEYPQIGVRMDEDFLKQIDEWRRKQDDLPTRPEAIRRICEIGLKAKK
jgi:hypothetical protein